MGELCLRWAMQLPANMPLTPDRRPLQSDHAARLLAHWENIGLVPVSRSFSILGRELMALDDATDPPPLPKTFLARRTGYADTTVRHTLQRFALIGMELMSASDEERRAYPTPQL
jgi:hypothetical protein